MQSFFGKWKQSHNLFQIKNVRSSLFVLLGDLILKGTLIRLFGSAKTYNTVVTKSSGISEVLLFVISDDAFFINAMYEAASCIGFFKDTEIAICFEQKTAISSHNSDSDYIRGMAYLQDLVKRCKSNKVKIIEAVEPFLDSIATK